jgi:ribonuclease HI
MYVVKTDGSFVGPPVNCGVGAYVISHHGRRVHEEAARDERVGSSTVAEALAIVKALLWLEEKGLTKEPIVVATDSRSVLDVVRGKVSTRSKMLKEFCDWIIAAARSFTNLVFLNCHRGEVSEAQQLARIALRPERQTVKDGNFARLSAPPPGASDETPAPEGSRRRRSRRGGRGRRRGAAPAAVAPSNGQPPAPREPAGRVEAPAPREAAGRVEGPPAAKAPPPAPPPPAPAPPRKEPPRRAPKPEPARPAALTFLQQAILKKKPK